MRSVDQFSTLWKEILSLVSLYDDINEDKTCRRRKLNPKFANSVVYETVGNRATSEHSECETDTKQLYFSIIDMVTSEMNARFSDQDSYLTALLASDPCNPNFLDKNLLKPLAALAGVDLNVS